MILQHASLPKILAKTSLLPVLSFHDLYSILNTIDVCYGCGIRAVEIRDSLNKKFISIFPEIIRHTEQYPDMAIGIYTNTLKNATSFCKGGAAFISSSFLRNDMANMALKFTTDWIPSCNSFADLQQAHALDAQIVSLLPGNYLPADLKTLKLQFPDLHFIPSSGIIINPQELTRWVNAGVLCIRMSQSLFPQGDVAAKDWVSIERHVLRALGLIRSLRTKEKQSTYSAFFKI